MLKKDTADLEAGKKIRIIYLCLNNIETIV